MKRFLCTALAVFTIFLNISVFSQNIYTKTSENYIAPGIKRTEIKVMTASGWQNINIVKASLKDKTVSASVLVPQGGINTLENVYETAKNYGAVCAVNADFFTWSGNSGTLGSPIGGVYEDGKLISSLDQSKNMASFGITQSEDLIFSYFDTVITITAPNGESTAIKSINKYEDLSEPAIYTKDFYDVTPGSYDNIFEVVVEKNVVKEIRSEQEGVKIPENGYVIRVLPEYSPFITENFATGDKIELKTEISPDLDNIKSLSGGGTLLLKDGGKTKITHDVSGKNPRTVAATDKEKNLYLITVDGRGQKATGMTLYEMQDFLLSINLTDAINFDGGGSTTLIGGQKGEQQVLNMPSGGSYLRKVSTAIGLFSTAQKTGVLKEFKISAADKNVFVGGTRTFNAYDFYDTSYYKTEPQKVTFETDKKYGYFKDNVLYATSVGENVLITAKSGSATQQMYINIISAPEKLKAKPFHFDISELNSFKTTVYGTNSLKQTALIESADLTVSQNKITNTGYKELTFAGKKTYISFSDIKEGFEQLDFSASGENAVLSLDTRYSANGNGLKLSYDFKGYSDNKKTACAVFNNPLQVEKDSKKVCLWVYSPFESRQWLRAEFKTEDGEILRGDFTEHISFSGYKYMVLTIPENAKYLTKIYVVQNDFKEQSSSFLVFDSLSFSAYEGEISLPSDLNKREYKESTQKKELSFVVTGELPKFNNLLSTAVISALENRLISENTDYVWSLPYFDFSKIEEKTAKGFSSFENGNSLFLNIDNSENYITHTQFGKIKIALQSKKDNLFVFLYEDLELMKDLEEKEVLKTLLKENGAKNIYVFYPSYTSKTESLEGITYVGAGRLNASGTKALKENPVEYIFVTTDGTNTEISIKKLF